ncbi:hypothetical protein D4764_11G0010890 [Takifugu flavidus]|uniref:Uncharacterized protein n=1 Tax=Takifugu flavidus TaxID=433684 RepID=A0A5C6PJR6_9TELE|nr:hypothetical protein D4764_11G0010890 [Takifugu flavidus]
MRHYRAKHENEAGGAAVMTFPPVCRCTSPRHHLKPWLHHAPRRKTLQKKVPRNWEPGMRVVWQQQERLQILICDCSHVTAAQPETFTSPELVSPSTTNEAEKPSTTDETEKPSTTDEDAPNSLSGVVMTVIISLYLFIVMVFLSSLIWFCIKSQKQIQEEPSAEMLAQNTVIYTNMRGKRKPPVKPLKPEGHQTFCEFSKKRMQTNGNIKTYENNNL